MPGLDKLEIAWAEDRATQGCDLSADPSADRSGAVLTVAPGWPCWPESDKSQGFGGRAPIWKKGHLPFEKTLTNGGESWSARVPLDPLFATGSISSKREGRPGGRPRTGGPPHNFCRPSGHGKNERHWAISLLWKFSPFLSGPRSKVGQTVVFLRNMCPRTTCFRGLSMPRKTTVAFRRGSSLRPVAKVGVALSRRTISKPKPIRTPSKAARRIMGKRRVNISIHT